MRSSRLHPSLKPCRTLGFVFLLVIVFCVGGCETAAPPVPAPPPAPKILPETDLQSIERLLKEGRYGLAAEKAEHLKDPAEKASWSRKVSDAWNLSDLKKADGMIQHGSPDQSLPLIDQILDRDPNFFEKAPVDLSRPVWMYYLTSKIRGGQEFWVLKNLQHASYLDSEDTKSLTVESYTHLAQRRMDEKKYHSALIDIRRALKIRPMDSKALSIRADLALLEKTWTDNGDMAFTRQHLHQALFYWGQVVDLNPQNKEVQDNIRKARSLLKKLEVLEKENKTR